MHTQEYITQRKDTTTVGVAAATTVTPPPGNNWELVSVAVVHTAVFYFWRRTLTFEGGFLIPKIIETKRRGLIAAFWRWAGLTFRNEQWYNKGITRVNVVKGIMEKAARAKNENVDKAPTS